MALYRGYSSFEYMKNKTFKLNDIELVKMDILNHIFTRKGERVMMPNFGSIVPDIVFEPLDSETLEILKEDIESIINYDPRVELVNLNMFPDLDNSSVEVHIKLDYLEFDLVDDMNLRIEFEA